MSKLVTIQSFHCIVTHLKHLKHIRFDSSDTLLAYRAFAVLVDCFEIVTCVDMVKCYLIGERHAIQPSVETNTIKHTTSHDDTNTTSPPLTTQAIDLPPTETQTMTSETLEIEIISLNSKSR
jgi:hypothetical protein